MRPRKYVAPPVAVRRKDRRLYDGFPDLDSCWEQTKEHRDYFIKYMSCPEKRQYHLIRGACKEFDDMIERWAGQAYRATFLRYYTIVGRKPSNKSYLQSLCSLEDSRKLLKMAIIRKTPEQLLEQGVPEEYDLWPATLEIQAMMAITCDEDKTIALNAVESCIKRRLLFRNACIKSCNSRIDTESHDNFVLILQILRARLILLSLA